ncbi:MAG: polysaccharide biosynthesis protein [Anaerofustis stercorihominis]|nr:polysaccharide biosynthesis protein [Anaerofustis stercorihominis]
MSEKRKKSFISGAVVLAAGSLIAKFLGIFFRIPVINILGDYGNGLYEYAYPLYNTFLAISTTGLPIAISKMVSEKMSSDDYFGAYRIFDVSTKTMGLLGAVISVTMFLSANIIITLSGWPQDTYYSIVAVSLAPFLVSLISAIRGFFQGMQMMGPSSTSQVFEQVGRVSFGLLLAYTLTNAYGVALGAAGATFGAVSGGLFGLGYLAFSISKTRKKHEHLIKATQRGRAPEDAKVIIRTLVITAIPMMMGSFVNTAMELINSVTIPNSLASIGYTVEEATKLIGTLGPTSTLTNVPLVLGSALSTSLVPFIAAAYARGEKKEVIGVQTATAMRTSFLVSLPCAIGLYVLSRPIFGLLYPNIDNYLGGMLLRYSALVGIFTIAGSNLQAILQGSGYFYKALMTLVCTAVVKVIANIVFVRIPALNIYGAILASMVSTIFLFVMNFALVKKYVGIGKVFASIMKTVICAVLMGVFANYSFIFISSLIGEKIGVLVAIALSAVVYVALLLITKTVTKEDIKEILG